jgi:FAD/FMN-containing dehydrogenase
MTLLSELQRLLGVAHVLVGADAQPYLVDWRGRYHGAARAVLRPSSPAEVAAVVKLCAYHGVPVVPQGGNTGLCGGATPDASGQAVVVSTKRLSRVRAIDTDNDTITVEAGCTLQAVQEAARAVGRLFPLSLAAEGSCTIGGNLATNAGGTQVLRYGNVRELALGLEVVTAEGEIWDGLRALRKDNTGYDLRDLYIGSEGTLGIITAATLKLFPQPAAYCTALIVLPDVVAALAMLGLARAGFGAALTSFELMSGECLQLVARMFPQQSLPVPKENVQAFWYVLIELSDSENEAHARQRFESIVGKALQLGVAVDAVIAENLAQTQALWRLRESIPLAESRFGQLLKHDVSLPVSHMAEFLRNTNAQLQARFPGVRHIIFGHLGDGNLHYNVGAAPGQADAQLLAVQAEVRALVHDSVHGYGGSISAEHGIGQFKRDELPRYKSKVELDLMKRIKQALDPHGTMNPGKVLQR